MLATFTK